MLNLRQLPGTKGGLVEDQYPSYIQSQQTTVRFASTLVGNMGAPLDLTSYAVTPKGSATPDTPGGGHAMESIELQSVMQYVEEPSSDEEV